MDANESHSGTKSKSQSRGVWVLVLLVLFASFAGQIWAAETKTVVFFGDSLTAGLGLDPDDAYPAVIQKKITAAGLPWRVVNAGLSGETTAGGLRRLDWILRQPIDIFVIELGANDGLRGLAPELTRANLEMMISRVRAHNPHVKIVLAGMKVPTNLGPDYTKAFASVYPAVAQKCGVGLIPFLLDGVGGRPELNQGDGMHPTVEGHVKVAETLWKVLLPLL